MARHFPAMLGEQIVEVMQASGAPTSAMLTALEIAKQLVIAEDCRRMEIERERLTEQLSGEHCDS